VGFIGAAIGLIFRDFLGPAAFFDLPIVFVFRLTADMIFPPLVD
jgi:hypothetical protein